jgi:hypothetical protein
LVECLARFIQEKCRRYATLLELALTQWVFKHPHNRDSREYLIEDQRMEQLQT